MKAIFNAAVVFSAFSSRGRLHATGLTLTVIAIDAGDRALRVE
jgi:hypothetical protein